MEISKTRRTIGWILSILPAAMLVFSAMMKLVGNQEMEEAMANSPLKEEIVYIGLLELLCVTLYFIPKTSNIGFFLLCSLVGGIIVAELTMGEAPIPGILLAVMFYVGTMLRKPELSGLGI